MPTRSQGRDDPFVGAVKGVGQYVDDEPLEIVPVQLVHRSRTGAR